MPLTNSLSNVDDIARANGVEKLRQEALLKTGALQNAILTSENFSIIATDEKGIIQLFNVGAERMLDYMAIEVVNKINPSDIHDPHEVKARAQALSLELETTITPALKRWPSRHRAASKTFTSLLTSARTAAAFRPLCQLRRYAMTSASSLAIC